MEESPIRRGYLTGGREGESYRKGGNYLSLIVRGLSGVRTGPIERKEGGLSGGKLLLGEDEPPGWREGISCGRD